MLADKHRGAENELRAVVWLLNQGYEVFRNVSPFGAVDIIATKDREILLIDVKTLPAKTGSKEHIARNVKFLVALPNGDFELRDPQPPINGKSCINCGTLITTSLRTRLYCSTTCENIIKKQKYHTSPARTPAMIEALRNLADGQHKHGEHVLPGRDVWARVPTLARLRKRGLIAEVPRRYEPRGRLKDIEWVITDLGLETLSGNNEDLR